MQIVCPQCRQTLIFETLAPRFCQHCGSGVAEIAAGKNGSEDASQLAADRTVAPKSSVFELGPFSGSADVDATVPPQGVAQTQSQTTMSVGQQVGPYQTTDWLGSGGMGSVWQAQEISTGRRVALKRLAPSMAADSGSLRRFTQEAQLAAKISHPHVTFIYGTGQYEGLPYIAMELMPGKTLQDVVESEGPLDVKRAVDHTLDVIDGLAAVHQQGMMHRDIKPSNCFLDTDGSVKIGDFGLSKSVDENDANLTKTGTFMGTPSYASPEQIRGIDVDARTDQYSVGATLFFLLTGKTPYQGDATSMMAQIIGDPPPSIRDHDSKLPPDLDKVIRKSLAKSAEDRFESLEALKVALLPYASRFNSVADVGRRLAAYMIDQTMLQILAIASITVFMIATLLRQGGGQLDPSFQSKVQYWSTLGMFVVMYFYYVIGEGRFGQTVGKWLMGLKLVDQEGQTAGLMRTALRAALVPAGLGISIIVTSIAYFRGELVQPTNPADMTEMMLKNMLLSFGPIVACLVTMRQSNRLTGLHGWISGTRVVRAASSAKRKPLPVASLPTKPVKELQFGPYRSTQLLGENESGCVYLAHDQQLNRDVWIVARDSGEAPGSSRMSLARHARQRWLDGGQCRIGDDCESDRRWDAFEAVKGMPLQQYVSMGKVDHCVGFARLMRQLVTEVRAALQDQTLPENVSLSQVWIDRDGHVRLLDSPLVKSIQVSHLDTTICPLSGEPRQLHRSPVEQAVELVQQLGDVMHRGRILPASLSQFLAELYDRPLSEPTLEWADRKLAKLETKKTNIRWDDRIGILAVTTGLEVIAVGTIAAVIMLAVHYLMPISLGRRAVLGVLVSLLFPITLAIYYRGGLVFNLMGIRVTQLDGRPASLYRTAIRAALSWLPLLAFGGAFMVLLIFADASQQAKMADEPGTLDYEITHDRKLIAMAFLTWLLSFATLIIGVLFAVFSPKRGLVDYLLGTRLMPD